jgi:hypothetical protein
MAREGSKEPSGAIAASGAVLIVDAVDAEHQRLCALFPASLPIDGCKTFNDALARARHGAYPLILLDADASVLNLGGIVAQMHVLQPEAAVVAARRSASTTSGARSPNRWAGWASTTSSSSRSLPRRSACWPIGTAPDGTSSSP